MRQRRRCIRFWSVEIDAWLSRISLGTLGCNTQIINTVQEEEMSTRLGRTMHLRALRTRKDFSLGWTSSLKTNQVENFVQHDDSGYKEELIDEDKKRKDMVTIVAIEYNDEIEIGRMYELASSLRMQMWLVRKGRDCKDLALHNSTLSSALYNCSEHKNVGREQGSFLQFISENYYTLPARLVLTAIDIDKFRHTGRNVRRDVIVRSSSIVNEEGRENYNATTFVCYTSHSLRQDADLSVALHGDTPQYPAKPSPLAAWVDAHMGAGTWKRIRKFAVCLKGTFYTTRQNIQARSREFYFHLAEQVNVDNSPEAGHFMERLDGVVFGAWDQEKYRATARLLCSDPGNNNPVNPNRLIANSTFIASSLKDCAPNASSSDSNRRLHYGIFQRGVGHYFDTEDDAIIPRHSSPATKFIPGLVGAALVLAALFRCWRAVTTTRRRRSQTSRLGRDA
mmetsp:Transcript_20956/g.27179  ORF Transcript_20956/g.27179 Transcript_20956/m.27179 type:complete len:451 (+) Transcript_20956:118-1470(+)